MQNKSSAPEDFDVVIVGRGPVGATLAAIAVLARWCAGEEAEAPLRNDAQG